jgi:hypothetical protein
MKVEFFRARIACRIAFPLSEGVLFICDIPTEEQMNKIVGPSCALFFVTLFLVSIISGISWANPVPVNLRDPSISFTSAYEIFRWLLIFLPSFPFGGLILVHFLQELSPRKIPFVSLWTLIMIITWLLLLIYINIYISYYYQSYFHRHLAEIETIRLLPPVIIIGIGEIAVVFLEAVAIFWLTQHPALFAIPDRLTYWKSFTYSLAVNIFSFAWGALIISVMNKILY